MKTLTDLKKVLTPNEKGLITLPQLVEGKAIYTEISQNGFKTKEYTMTNLAQAILNKALKSYVEKNDLTDIKKTIFIGENGYNVVLSTKQTDGTFNKEVAIKVKNESMIIDLIDNHGFYLVS